MSDFDSLREDVPEYVGSILKALESQRDLNEAWTRLFEAYSDEIASLWKDNAALRDELHAVANRVESLTRARLTEPAEVAERMVRPSTCKGGSHVWSESRARFGEWCDCGTMRYGEQHLTDEQRAEL